MALYASLCAYRAYFAMTNSNRTLLFDEPPIAISPTLCKILGLQAAVLLQQLHYWLENKSAAPDRYKDHYINGRYWVYWTHEQLQKSVPLGKSIDPYKRLIKELKSLGILLVAQHRAGVWDRTNFYSIDYDCFNSYIEQQSMSFMNSGNSTTRDDAAAPVDNGEGTSSTSEVLTDHKETEKTIKTSLKTTTTTTVVVDDEGVSINLYLLENSEQYRPFIERGTADLNRTIAQNVADEVSGTILAIEQGQRGKVFGFGQWISALCVSAAKGELVGQYGPAIATKREAIKLAESASLKKNQDDENARILVARDTNLASEVIHKIGEQALTELISKVVVTLPFQSLRQAVSDALLSRQLPDGPGRGEAIRLLNIIGGAHECNV